MKRPGRPAKPARRTSVSVYVDGFQTTRRNTMGGYGWIILGVLVGFFVVAYLLLAPVNRFLKREEEASKQWTRDVLSSEERQREPATDGQRENGQDAPTRPSSP